MTTQEIKRKLIAILSADVRGDSRLVIQSQERVSKQSLPRRFNARLGAGPGSWNLVQTHLVF